MEIQLNTRNFQLCNAWHVRSVLKNWSWWVEEKSTIIEYLSDLFIFKLCTWSTICKKCFSKFRYVLRKQFLTLKSQWEWISSEMFWVVIADYTFAGSAKSKQSLVKLPVNRVIAVLGTLSGHDLTKMLVQNPS